MSATVRRLPPDEIGRLCQALGRRRHLFLEGGYKLPRATALRWAGHVFGEAAEDEGHGCALVAEDGGEVVGGLVLRRAPFEASLYGVPMARVPWIFTVAPADVAGSRVVGAALLEALEPELEALGSRHVSALLFAEDQGLVHAFGDAGWRLVDSTLDFTWACGRTTPAGGDDQVHLRAAIESDRSPLTALAREAYTHMIQTRYSVDPWLPIERTGELYARWFELAMDGEFGDVVVVAEVDGQPVGFNTFKLDRALSAVAGVGFASHGIAAVLPGFRGRASQPAMLHWLAEWQRERGGSFNRGRVLLDNYPMQRACLKSGAFVTQSYHTFHTWRGPPPEWGRGP